MMHRQQGKLVTEMDIGNQRNVDLVFDFPDGGRRCFIGHGDTDEFAARILQLPDLGDRGPYVTRVRRGHGLDNHRRIAADLNTA
jgi:hypothetical protein